MRVIGLTGGVGMGKSTVAEMLRRRGVSLIDTDYLARMVVQRGQPALAEVQRAFGPDLVDSSGDLRRGDLAKIVFEDPTARKRLEEILHPPIRTLWRDLVDAWRAEGRSRAVVVIPLLFETGAERDLDTTVCVACSAATQKVRLLQRGWSDTEIQQRIDAQWPVARKMELSDYVIWTEGSFEVTEMQLTAVAESQAKRLSLR